LTAWAITRGGRGRAGDANVNRNTNINRNTNTNRYANISRNVNVNRNVNVVVRPVRPRVRRPYYGTVIVSVVLGTITAATTTSGVSRDGSTKLF
jgi:hypothetical protein